MLLHIFGIVFLSTAFGAAAGVEVGSRSMPDGLLTRTGIGGPRSGEQEQEHLRVQRVRSTTSTSSGTDDHDSESESEVDLDPLAATTAAVASSTSSATGPDPPRAGATPVLQKGKRPLKTSQTMLRTDPKRSPKLGPSLMLSSGAAAATAYLSPLGRGRSHQRQASAPSFVVPGTNPSRSAGFYFRGPPRGRAGSLVSLLAEEVGAAASSGRAFLVLPSGSGAGAPGLQRNMIGGAGAAVRKIQSAPSVFLAGGTSPAVAGHRSQARRNRERGWRSGAQQGDSERKFAMRLQSLVARQAGGNDGYGSSFAGNHGEGRERNSSKVAPKGKGSESSSTRPARRTRLNDIKDRLGSDVLPQGPALSWLKTSLREFLHLHVYSDAPSFGGRSDLQDHDVAGRDDERVQPDAAQVDGDEEEGELWAGWDDSYYANAKQGEKQEGDGGLVEKFPSKDVTNASRAEDGSVKQGGGSAGGTGSVSETRREDVGDVLSVSEDGLIEDDSEEDLLKDVNISAWPSDDMVELEPLPIRDQIKFFSALLGTHWFLLDHLMDYWVHGMKKSSDAAGVGRPGAASSRAADEEDVASSTRSPFANRGASSSKKPKVPPSHRMIRDLELDDLVFLLERHFNDQWGYIVALHTMSWAARTAEREHKEEEANERFLKNARESLERAYLLDAPFVPGEDVVARLWGVRAAQEQGDEGDDDVPFVLPDSTFFDHNASDSKAGGTGGEGRATGPSSLQDEQDEDEYPGARPPNSYTAKETARAGSAGSTPFVPQEEGRNWNASALLPPDVDHLLSRIAKTRAHTTAGPLQHRTRNGTVNKGNLSRAEDESA